MAHSGIKKAVFSETLRSNLIGYLPILLVWPTVWLSGLPIIGSSNSAAAASAITAMIVAIRSFGNRRIVVDSRSLAVGSLEIPLSSVAKAEAISPTEKRDQMGPKLNANARVFYKAGSKGLVRIELQSEKWPYLLVSTNRASELVSALKS
jgi:hypothetical protein